MRSCAGEAAGAPALDKIVAGMAAVDLRAAPSTAPPTLPGTMCSAQVAAGAAPAAPAGCQQRRRGGPGGLPAPPQGARTPQTPRYANYNMFQRRAGRQRAGRGLATGGRARPGCAPWEPC